MLKFMKTLLAITLASLFLTACLPDESAPTKKETQAEKARKAADAVTFTENAEIENIQRRLELTSAPGLLGYVALINRVGQVALYTPVKGKITSGGKRLTQPHQMVPGDGGQYTRDFVTPAPSDEGTWGSSNPYVYFWTPGDQYIQTSLEYVYSDKPFRLNEEPLMILAETPVPEKRAEVNPQ